MTVAVAAAGLLVFVLGIVGIVQPATLVVVVARLWHRQAALYLAILFRVVLGIILIAGAASTRFPWIIGGLGVVSLAAAAAIPILGYSRLRAFVDWWLRQPPVVIRAWASIACAFGGFLIYSVI